jgi:hypothetical protein
MGWPSRAQRPTPPLIGLGSIKSSRSLRCTPIRIHQIRSPRSASTSARTRSTSSVSTSEAPSCCGSRYPAANSSVGSPMYRAALSPWRPAAVALRNDALQQPGSFNGAGRHASCGLRWHDDGDAVGSLLARVTRVSSGQPAYRQCRYRANRELTTPKGSSKGQKRPAVEPEWPECPAARGLDL